MQNTILDGPVFKSPLISLMMSVSAAELTERQFKMLSLIIVETFDSSNGAIVVTPKFISTKAFENYTRYKAEVIHEILDLLIENRLVFRTYPDKTGLPFYAINPDSDTWAVWDDAPVASPPPQDTDSQHG